MIISCNNCSKKFNVDAGVIPEKGRLLECNNCNYKWFFKKEIINEPIPNVKVTKPADDIELFKKDFGHEENDNYNDLELLDKKVEEDFVTEKISLDVNKKKSKDTDQKIYLTKDKKNYNILSLIIVFIISFVAVIIIIDTFQVPISKHIPNIEFLLYNLYETISDIRLFFNDLI